MDYMNTDLGSDTNSEESIQVQSEGPKDMNLINTKTVQLEPTQLEPTQLEPTQLEPSQLEPIRTTSTKASDETPANILSSLSRFQSQNNYAEADITETPTEYKESYSQESYSQESYSQQTHNTKLDELMSLMTTLLAQATILHEKIQEEKEKTGTLSVTQKKEEKELLELKLKLFC
jgi:hypothetical protein